MARSDGAPATRSDSSCMPSSASSPDRAPTGGPTARTETHAFTAAIKAPQMTRRHTYLPPHPRHSVATSSETQATSSTRTAINITIHHTWCIQAPRFRRDASG